MSRLLALFLYAVSLSVAVGVERVDWVHVPAAAFRGDRLTMVLHSDQQLRLGEDQGLEASLEAGANGQWFLRCIALPGHRLSVISDSDRRPLRFVGSNEPLNEASEEGPRLADGVLLGADQELLVPVAERQERGRDRRYQWLRSLGGRPSSAEEGIDVFWPQASRRGISPLLNSVGLWSRRLPSADQRAAVHLLVMDVREESVGWDRYSFMALLTWQIRRHQQTGARVLLLKPPMDRFRQPLMESLIAAMAEVATDTGIDLLAYPQLYDDAFWFDQPGVLRPWLNESGRRALQDALAADLGQVLTIPVEGWVAASASAGGDIDQADRPEP